MDLKNFDALKANRDAEAKKRARQLSGRRPKVAKAVTALGEKRTQGGAWINLDANPDDADWLKQNVPDRFAPEESEEDESELGDDDV
jgi:hypothetical protein